MARPRPLDWNDLRYFLVAARAGTLAGAARALGVDHTTIGRRLTALERTLGTPLVLRNPEGVQLTAAGGEVLALAEQMERSAAAVEETAASQRARVRLSVPSGFVRLFNAGLARQAREHAEISLEIMSGSRVVDLRKGEADLALRVGTITDPDLIARKFGEVGWSLYASEAYLARRSAPQDPRQLAGHEIIGFDDALSASPGARWIAEHGKGATIVVKNREVTDMLAAAAGGLGLAMLPCLLASTEPLLRRLTREVIGQQTLSLVYRREVLQSQAVRTVIRLVTGVIRAHIGALAGAP